ncbi:(2Fe-2S)-binding protein [Variovorax sp. RHLX14]|uniref:(2Fe-2S)-binding protein n=1 Tax=Variovorax sp. RHLX14 TaxID=1259731 RepID=UPI003F48D1D6
MPDLPSRPRARFMRLAETDRPSIALRIDGESATALTGDTLLVALLTHGRRVRDSEFGDGPRAGFCLMGACQDCWVWTEDGSRLRACSTVAEAGMSVLTRPPAAHWPATPDLTQSLARKAAREEAGNTMEPGVSA